MSFCSSQFVPRLTAGGTISAYEWRRREERHISSSAAAALKGAFSLSLSSSFAFVLSCSSYADIGKDAIVIRREEGTPIYLDIALAFALPSFPSLIGQSLGIVNTKVAHLDAERA